MANYDNIHQLFKKISSLNSVMNELPSTLYFHALMGAYFKDKIISFGATHKDLRVHPFWVQPSRTGKDQLNKILKIVAETLGLDVVVETDLTSDASLIGTYDPEADKFNKEHGLSRDVKYLPKKRGEGAWEYRDPVIKGDLGLYDVVIIPEGKLFFQTKSEKLLSTLQPALDYPGYVRKKMKHREPIEYECSATLVVTSIPFKEMKQSIVEQGFFQRVALYIRRMSIEEIEVMRNKADELRDPETHNKFRKLLKEFKGEFSKFNRKQERIIVQKETIDVLKDYRKKFINEIRSKIVGPEVMPSLSFTQTAEDLALKIAGHICLLEGRKEITPNDLKKAFYPAFHFVRTVVDEIEIGEEQDYKKELLFVRKMISLNNGKVMLTHLCREMMKTFSIGMPTARRYVELLKDMNFIKFERGQKNTVWVRNI